MLLGAFRLKRVSLVLVVLVLASMSFLSCGSSGSYGSAPTGLNTRVLASQSVSSPTAIPSLVVIDGENDTLPRLPRINAGNSPGLMAMTPNRALVLAFDSVTNSVEVVNSQKASLTGAITLPGPTTSMVALSTGSGYAAVPTATLIGSPPGAVVVMNIVAGGITATISVPNAQTVVASPDGTHLLVFSSDSNSVTVMSPLLVNTGNQVTVTVPGFDQPVYGVFSADGSTAYILNCGPECGSTSASASIQTLNMTTLAVGPPLAVDGATIGWLNGSTLYVAGTPTASVNNLSPNNSCTSQTTAATICGRLDLVDLGSMTVTSSAVITNGYHNRIDMSVNGQLFIGGAFTCTNIGNVANPQGEVRGCLSIYNTNNAAVVIPPDNGDVTGLQSFTTRDVEYVAEGGNLRVYNTLIDALLVETTDNITETGTIVITGKIIDVKAIDFF
jgi:hypothetical protein